MSGKLLDTNAVVALQKSDPAMVEFLKANTVLIPSIVLGELYYGAYNSGRAEANLRVNDDFAVSNEVIDCDKTTARIYGQVRYQLKAKGKMIPENDVWIAAIARQYNLTVITRDEHFQHVDGLTVESW